MLGFTQEKFYAQPKQLMPASLAQTRPSRFPTHKIVDPTKVMKILNACPHPVTIRELSAMYDPRKDGPDQRNRIGVMVACWAGRQKVKKISRGMYAHL
jgi:hypothetical protein